MEKFSIFEKYASNMCYLQRYLSIKMLFFICSNYAKTKHTKTNGRQPFQAISVWMAYVSDREVLYNLNGVAAL